MSSTTLAVTAAKEEAKGEGILHYLSLFEPVRLRAAYVALLALLAVFGVSIPADWDSEVISLLAALAVILPAIQAVITRRAVTPPGTQAVLEDQALNTAPPGPVVTPWDDPSPLPSTIDGPLEDQDNDTVVEDEVPE